MVMTRAPEIRTLLRRWPRTLRVSTLPGGTTEYTSIAAAVAYADSQGGEWTLLCDGGTYNEGDITPNGGANITIRALGPGRVSIAPTVAPAAGVVVSGFTLRLEDVIVTAPDATMPALRVTGGTCVVAGCSINGVGAGDSIQQVAGVLTLQDGTVVGAGDIDLSTAPCTFNAYHSRVTTDPIDTAGAFAHAITLVNCDLGGQNLASAATGATTLSMGECDNVGTVTNAGTGAFTVRESYIASVNQTNAAGTVILRGGTLLACAGATGSVVWWLNSYELKVITGMVIQHAVDAAVGGETVLIGPGTFTGSVACNSAADVVTLRGMSRDRTILTQAAAGVLTVTDITGVCVENLTIQMTAGAGHVGVGVAPTNVNAGVILRDVVINITGTLATSNYGIATFGGVGVASVYATGVVVSASNTQAGASATGGISLGNNGGTATLRNCSFTATDTNGTARGIWVSTSSVSSYNCTYGGTGTTGEAVYIASSATSIMRSYNDSFAPGVINKGALGVMTCKSTPQQYEVWAGMSIGDAITAAAADNPAPAAANPYTVLIHPGIFNESIGTSAAYVHLKGLKRDSVVITQDSNTVITIVASNIEVANLTLRLANPTGARAVIALQGAASGIRFYNVAVSLPSPNGFAHEIIRCEAGAVTATFEKVSYSVTDAANPGVLGFNQVVGPHIITFLDCDLEINSTGGVVIQTVAGGATFITFTNCRLAGTARHILATVGLIRLRNCQYRSVVRAGTADILDESPEAKDYAYHVVKTPLETLDNLTTRTAVGGAVTLGGSGQLRLRINDNAADEAGIENNTDPAGALDSSFTAGRSIRYVRQVSVNAFRATTNMFFGLRATLGGAVPGAAEDHFGFIWNGANFIASSSDGAGVGQATHLTTPSVATQHQLEAIQLWTQVEFYVDGVLVATHANAAGIPTAGGTLDFQDWEESDGLGGATTSDVTLRNGFIQECPA